MNFKNFLLIISLFISFYTSSQNISGTFLGIASETKQTINMQNYPASTYFVKVIDKEKEIKVFKIIKK